MTSLIGVRVWNVFLVSMVLYAFDSTDMSGQVPDKNKQKFSGRTLTGSPRYSLLNINNITTWMRSDGHSNHSPGADNGLYYPRGTGNVIYQDCLVWGGKVFTNPSLTSGPGMNPPGHSSQPIRIGGGTYGVGTRSGAVVGSGASAVAEDPNAASVRIYRIRRDYSTITDEDLRRDAASYYELYSEVAATQAQMDAVKAQYATDWTNWPVSKGAPYVDRNGNGVYDPPPPFSSTFTAESLITQGRDEPGVSGIEPDTPADQVVWTVYNDLDVPTTFDFENSNPIGLEIQKTVWGYDRTDALGNVYFSRYKFINKGGVDTSSAAGDQFGSFWIDSMYICQWSDPDLGSFADDLLGCDSTLSLGYVYNSTDVDNTFQQFNLAPPAGGYDFLAGPVVPSPGDSAIVDLKRRYGVRNLQMSSFAYFSAGSPYSDPGGDYFTGAARWWKMLRGFAPLGDWTTGFQPYDFPGTVGPSKFPLSGDPVTGTGWIDGLGQPYSFVTGDRRILVTTGPFSLAPGDTQEVYIGFVAGIGADRLSSITIMKTYDHAVQQLFDNLFNLPPFIARSVDLRQSDSASMEIRVRITPPQELGVQSAEVQFEPQTGSETAFSLILHDDGLHSDSLAGDGIWGNDQAVSNRKYPYRASLVLQTSSGSINDDSFLFNLTVRPKPYLSNWNIVWEEGKQDMKINTDEMVLLQFTLNNADGIHAIDNLKIFNLDKTDGGYGSVVMNSGVIAAGSTVSGDGYTLSLRGSGAGSDSVSLPFSVSFDGNTFGSSAAFPIESWTPASSWRDTLHVVSVVGFTSSGVIPIVADPSLLTGDDYLVTFALLDSTTRELGWSLKNERTNTTLLVNQILWLGDVVWPHPVVDGIQYLVSQPPQDFQSFQVVANASGPLASPDPGAFAFQGFPTPDNGNPLSQVAGGAWAFHTWPDASTSGGGARGPYSAFLGRSMRNDNFDRLIPFDWEMRFTAGGGYAVRAFQDSVVNTVPFELWNIGVGTPTDASDDYRLIPWLFDLDGSNDYGMINDDHPGSGADNDPYTDPIYWRIPADTTAGTAGYDAFVAALDFSSPPATGVGTDGTYLYDSPEVIARSVLVNWNGSGSIALPDAGFPGVVDQLMPEQGTIFRLISQKRNQPDDAVRVSSVISGIAEDVNVPGQYGLSQNYPNPFNPTTTIKYTLPKRQHIQISIYNMLGQHVRTIVDGFEMGGKHLALWDGKNDRGYNVSTGVYFYTISAGSFRKTKKMLLLK